MIPDICQGELETKDLIAKEFMDKIEKFFSSNPIVESRELFTKLPPSNIEVEDK